MAICLSYCLGQCAWRQHPFYWDWPVFLKSTTSEPYSWFLLQVHQAIFFFLWERAHWNTSRIWREQHHSMAWWRLLLLVPIIFEIPPTFDSCVLMVASNKTLLRANKLFEVDLLIWFTSSLKFWMNTNCALASWGLR